MKTSLKIFLVIVVVAIAVGIAVAIGFTVHHGIKKSKHPHSTQTPNDCCGKAIVSAKSIKNSKTNDPKVARTVMNASRAANNVKELQWDTKLASQANAYAQWLADNDKFEHGYIGTDKARHALYAAAGGNPKALDYDGTFGQNLAMGSGADGNIAFLTQSWIKECNNCDHDNYCKTSETHDEVGHYTQALWRGTTHVGCGTASKDDQVYLVCNFNPPGNMMNADQFKANVPILECAKN